MAMDRDCRAYGLSHLGKSLLWVGGDALTIFLLMSRAGIAPALAGSLFVIMLMWNAVCDLLVGRWHDRRRAEGRSTLAGIALAIPVACLAFPASLLAPRGDVVWVFASGLIFRTAFAIFDVPHNALIADLARTEERGTRLAQLRTLGSGVASVAIGLVAMPLLGEGERNPAAPAGLLCLLAAGSGLLMLPYLRLAGQIPPVGHRERAPGHRRVIPAGLLRFFMASAVGMVAVGAISKAPPHLDLSSTSLPGAALLVLMLGRFASVAIAGPLVSWLGARRMLVSSYLALAGIILGLAPAASIGGPVILGWIGLLGVSIGLIGVMSWVRLPEFARAAPEQSRAVTFGAYTMVSKFALGLSGLVLTLAFGAPLDAGAGVILSHPALLRLCLAAAIIAVTAALMLAAPWSMRGASSACDRGA